MAEVVEKQEIRLIPGLEFERKSRIIKLEFDVEDVLQMSGIPQRFYPIILNMSNEDVQQFVQLTLNGDPGYYGPGTELFTRKHGIVKIKKILPYHYFCYIAVKVEGTEGDILLTQNDVSTREFYEELTNEATSTVSGTVDCP